MISADTTKGLAELVLALNSFEFNGEFFNQISGVVMRTKMNPRYSCIFMGYKEHKVVLQQYTGRLPELYITYIDDDIGVTDMSLVNFRSMRTREEEEEISEVH